MTGTSSPIRPYGDTTGDGMVQLSFTLPMPHSKVAEGAAVQLANKMGMDPALVVHSKVVPFLRLAREHWTLSTAAIRTWVTRGSRAVRAAAVAIASSASNSIIGHTAMPSAADARSASSNWPVRPSGNPSPVL